MKNPRKKLFDHNRSGPGRRYCYLCDTYIESNYTTPVMSLAWKHLKDKHPSVALEIIMKYGDIDEDHTTPWYL